jgi:hypothetical protein
LVSPTGWPDEFVKSPKMKSNPYFVYT